MHAFMSVTLCVHFVPLCSFFFCVEIFLASQSLDEEAPAEDAPAPAEDAPAADDAAAEDDAPAEEPNDATGIFFF